MPSMTFKEAARLILAEAGTPLHAHEIARRAIEAGLVATAGKTPEATMEAALCVAVSGPQPAFVRTSPRTFALAGSAAAEAVSSSDDGFNGGARRIRVPHFPATDELLGFLRAVPGLAAERVTQMRGTFAELRGTPQSNVDWSAPDAWIDEPM